MQPKDAFDELRKAKEEEYFRRRESDLLEKLRLRAAGEAGRRELGSALETTDPQILEDLQALGYNAETVKILFTVPLIYVAWADGSVTPRERSLILEFSKVEDKLEGGAVQRQLTQWLDERPAEEFFERTFRVIKSLLAVEPAEERSATKRGLHSNAVRIAEASGGLLGLGSISKAERAAMERVAAEIERGHSEASRQILDRL
jgi:tellurite resistance protein